MEPLLLLPVFVVAVEVVVVSPLAVVVLDLEGTEDVLIYWDRFSLTRVNHVSSLTWWTFSVYSSILPFCSGGARGAGGDPGAWGQIKAHSYQ